MGWEGVFCQYSVYSISMPLISVMPSPGLALLRAFLPLICVRACGQVLHHGFELGACLHDYHFDHEDFRLHFLLN